MGSYLNKPKTEAHSLDLENHRLRCGVSSMQGWRDSQEDAHNCILDFDEDVSLFAVYDGHGGAEVAQYASANLPALIKKVLHKEKDVIKALKKAYLDFDSSLIKHSVLQKLIALREAHHDSKGADKNNPEVSESSSSTNVCDSSVTSKDDKKFDYEKNWYELPAESNDGLNSETDDDDDDDDDYNEYPRNQRDQRDSGCTAVTALLVKNRLYVANAGDSRCVVSINGKAYDMSKDHKPEDERELNRIVAAGGNVSNGRVNGGLNLSRSLGDHYCKKNYDLPNTRQMISALPDVKVIDLSPKSSFIVLACDGIWNSLSSQEVVDFVSKYINLPDIRISPLCEELFRMCLAPDTDGDGTGCDNMTCIIIKLKPPSVRTKYEKVWQSKKDILSFHY